MTRAPQLIAGIDEAGRGPMVGPLVVCGISISLSHLSKLELIGVKDSKALTPHRRQALATQIREIADAISLQKISAQEIDILRKDGVTLNSIEADAFASIVKELRPDIVYMDAADVNANRFAQTVAERCNFLPSACKFIAEHRADNTYPVVSAASIIAKVTRDAEISRYHALYGDFGSGYPSDPKTVSFFKALIKSGAELPPIVRKSWKSIERITAAAFSEQTTLGAF